jgi:type IV pilus assembly protein PilN
MIRINLLPHRAEKRKRRQIQFISLSVVAIILGVVLVLFVHGVISARILFQEQRNQFLNGEIAKLVKQIEELNKLKAETQALMARKEVVENLQSTRSDVVHLMDQMLRILPDGVYLKAIKQVGVKIDLAGYAQSDARVSSLIDAIESSPWLNTPLLIETHAVSVNNARMSEFSLKFNLTVKPAAPAAAAKK